MSSSPKIRYFPDPYLSAALRLFATPFPFNSTTFAAVELSLTELCSGFCTKTINSRSDVFFGNFMFFARSASVEYAIVNLISLEVIIIDSSGV